MTTDVKQRSGASPTEARQRSGASPTRRPRRRRPARAARRLVGGASVAAVLGLVAAWSAAPDATAAAAAAVAPADVRVVITDPAIDRESAIAAALDAAARGVDRVEVPVAGSTQPSGQVTGSAAHSTSHAS